MREQLVNRLFHSLLRIRRVEEEVARVYPSDKIKSPVHLSIGQEAVSVGVCEALALQDVVFGTYRSHALYLARGGNLNKMIAELYGKATGCSRGKGGSMHLIAPEVGLMGTSAVVGTTIPNAVGYAYGMKEQGLPGVVVSFFGDGAVEEGVFYESINFASLKKLPILFVCENNGYAIHTHQSRRQAIMNIAERVAAFGVSARRIPDNDIFQIFEATQNAVGKMREGTAGPCFLECMTYRWKEHVGPGEDFHLGYRGAFEAAPWIENDQVRRLARMVSQSRKTQIERDVEAEIEAAFAFAETSPFPSIEELYTDVFDDNANETPCENRSTTVRAGRQ